MSVSLGAEWLVDAHGCDPALLRSKSSLETLFDRLVEELGLHTLAPPQWHVFPGQGGVTGFLLLSESHLACHTFPEHGSATINLYSCQRLGDWPWAERLRDLLAARRVRVRFVERGER